MPMYTLTIIVIIVGAIAVGILGRSAAERLRASYLHRLERRYGARWTLLSLDQKERVLRTMGVHLWFEADRDPAHTDAKLNDLFLAVLASSGRDHLQHIAHGHTRQCLWG